MALLLSPQDLILWFTDVYTAAALRNERVVKILLKEAANNEFFFRNNARRALYRCSQEGDVATAKFIFQVINGSRSEIRMTFGWYLVGNAYCGNLDMIAGLLVELRVYYRRQQFLTTWAAQQAAWEGHHDIVALLLEAFPYIRRENIRLRLIAAYALKENVDAEDKRIFPSIVDMLLMEYGLDFHELDRRHCISPEFPVNMENYRRRS